MDAIILIALFEILSPFTVGGDFHYCRFDACPKISCGKGWEYRGYDMNGRKYATCRNYTKMGIVMQKAEHWMVTFGKHFSNERSKTKEEKEKEKQEEKELNDL